MKVYRLRHIPTGLFFGPKRRVKAGETNLFEKGKIYPQMPSYDTSLYGGYQHEGRYHRTNPSEWEVVQYELTETGTVRLGNPEYYD